MSRDAVIAAAHDYFDSEKFTNDLSRRIAIPTESQKPSSLHHLYTYLNDEMIPAFDTMGHECRVFENPVGNRGPVLLATRIEGKGLPTVLGYGHGDVIRGLEDQWGKGLNPWKITQVGGKLYGRGTADNKGQHTVNMAALEKVLIARGKLGFNSKFVVEMGEEAGSPGLDQIIDDNLDAFSADVFIASDGPRVAPNQPTIFLGARGCINFDLSVDLREGAHHSGNWGGLLSNPGIILSHALSSIISPAGQILIKKWLPPPLSNTVRNSLAEIIISGGNDAPEIDMDWGEPGLKPAERVYAWNNFEVLAFKTGNPERPVNAVPPRARANCQIRYVAGTDHKNFLPVLREHLDERGFSVVEIQPPPEINAVDFIASATAPDDPWATWVSESIERTTGKETVILPSLGGSICNDLFNISLGLPTIWVPHSYAACCQHAPNEHILMAQFREALGIMAGIYWDLGEGDTPKHLV
ncbi:MAG: hypothetical protein CBB68_08975 [Rhodospirillaceae bacterium TMED8]|nr:hypothetical protein [Magnetovibrio sp.]OUT50493.1 MAG: hypothetical protein CBB68_08975 [Rhodospirillaceae bacterium TMED8]|tara:strand:+ start:108 stop:1514 length:1407 start_codon:yes stop_codon:yes gene_type:complete